MTRASGGATIPARVLAVLPGHCPAASSKARPEVGALARFRTALERELQQLTEDLESAPPVLPRTSSGSRSLGTTPWPRVVRARDAAVEEELCEVGDLKRVLHARGAAPSVLPHASSGSRTPMPAAAAQPRAAGAGGAAVGRELCQAGAPRPLPVAVGAGDALGDIRVELGHDGAGEPQKRSSRWPARSSGIDQCMLGDIQVAGVVALDSPKVARHSNFSLPEVNPLPEISKSRSHAAVARRMKSNATNISGHPGPFAARVLESRLVRIGVPTLILLSALSMGFEAHWAVQHPTDPTVDGSQVVDLLLTACFTAELVLRALSETRFFMHPSNPNFQWNLFDSAIVLTGVADLILGSLSTLSMKLDLSAVRLLRMLRLARVIRVIRLMRFFRDLRVMVAGILGSLRSLLWAMVLLLLIMFMFAVGVMQIAAEELASLERERAGSSPERVQAVEEASKALVYWYGGLFRSLYTLYMAITGGVSWIEPAEVLVGISPALGAAYCLYIAFGLLCVLNIVTGVFVDNTNKMYSNDEDQVAIDEMERAKTFAKDLQALFEDLDADGSGHVTKAEFSTLLRCEKLKAMLRAQYNLNVDHRSASALFDMFDLDGSGQLNIEEFIYSVQRFHGSATSIDLARVALSQKRMGLMIEELSKSVEQMCGSRQVYVEGRQEVPNGGTQRSPAPDTPR